MAKWILASSLIFGALGLLSLLITDLIFLPRTPGSEVKLYFLKEPILVVSTSLFPAFFAYIASRKWLYKGSKYFRGWLSVAMFSWISLVINPFIWALVLATFLFYGFVVLVFLLAGGVILKISWHIMGNTKYA